MKRAAALQSHRPPGKVSSGILLDVRQNRQVKLGSDDEGRAAPVRLARTAAASRTTKIAGEREALLLGGVGVVVAEVNREHALGESGTHVPGPVVRQVVVY